jgi:antitoxin component HigA of HigAB toxin-antitoxin module
LRRIIDGFAICEYAESTISAVLKGARTLTRQHIARLAAYFRVSPAAFDFDAQRA